MLSTALPKPRRRVGRTVFMIAVLGVLGALPLALSSDFWLRIAIFVWINGLLALSLHVILRAGQLSLAQASFMAIGAYTSAQATLTFGLPFIVALPLAGAVAAVIAVVIGAVILRLRSVYFVLGSFALAEFIFLLSKSATPITGGNTGLPGIPAPTLPLLGTPIRSNTAFYYLAGTVALAGLAFVIALYRSRMGHAMAAVGASELLAASSGLNTMRVKIFAFAISAMLGGFGGSLFAHYMSYIAPTDFTFWKSVDLLIMNVVGGLGYVLGPFMGAALITPVPELFRAYLQWQQILNGLVLLAAVLLLPGGLAQVLDVRGGHVRSAFGWVRRRGRPQPGDAEDLDEPVAPLQEGIDA